MKFYDSQITSLFSGMQSQSPFAGVDLGDYASIKNGSYKKLVKSYYGLQAPKKTTTAKPAQKTDETQKTQGSAKPGTSSLAPVKKQDKTGLTQLKKESDGLKSAAGSLAKPELWKKKDGKYDMPKIGEAVKKFADQYNQVLEKAEKVKSKEVSQSVGYMKSMTDTMSKALEKVGVSVDKQSGKLSVDEEKLASADERSVKALFGTKASYASSIEDKADEISKATVMNSSIYDGNGLSSSALLGAFEQFV